MEYRVLGALEAIDKGVAVTPTAPKLRNMLAVLLLNQNRVVSRTTLIDEIWPSDPPTTVLMTLTTYIYQLRKLLAAGPSQETKLLATKPGGYALTVEQGSLDLSTFEATVARGRQEFAAGRFAEASCQLRTALGLHRGPVLAGLSKGPLLAGIAAHIEEDMLDAIALRIEIDLQLGRHRELIGELSSLVAQHPTNEDFHAKLIIALYRSDRRSVALETYQRLHRSLRHDFGIDPSPRLKQLHMDILADAPTLRPPAAAKAGGLALPAY